MPHWTDWKWVMRNKFSPWSGLSTFYKMTQLTWVCSLNLVVMAHTSLLTLFFNCKYVSQSFLRTVVSASHHRLMISPFSPWRPFRHLNASPDAEAQLGVQGLHYGINHCWGHLNQQGQRFPLDLVFSSMTFYLFVLSTFDYYFDVFFVRNFRIKIIQSIKTGQNKERHCVINLTYFSQNKPLYSLRTARVIV